MIYLSKFAENLFSIMQENNLTAPKLAKIIKTDRSNVTRYLRAERLPSFNCFVAIIDYFKISADVLLGLTDYSVETIFLPVQPFSKRLRAVMQENNATQYQIEKQLKISGSSMYNWLFGKSLPNVENLVKLAEYLNVSIDYLLGRVN